MTIIDLNNHNQLPDTPLIGYILLSPEEAAAEHTRRWGVVKTVYRVTRGKKVTLYIEKTTPPLTPGVQGKAIAGKVATHGWENG